RLLRVALDRLAQPFLVQRMLGDIVAVQLTSAELCRRPVGLQLQPGVNSSDRITILPQRELRLGEQEIALCLIRSDAPGLLEALGGSAIFPGRERFAPEFLLASGFGELV